MGIRYKRGEIKKYGTGERFVWVRTKLATFVSCYLTTNATVPRMEQCQEELDMVAAEA